MGAASTDNNCGPVTVVYNNCGPVTAVYTICYTVKLLKPASNFMYHQFRIYKFHTVITFCLYVSRTKSDFRLMQQ
jgi:hypothetical protein